MTELVHLINWARKHLIVKSVTSKQFVAKAFTVISIIWILKRAQFHRAA